MVTKSMLKMVINEIIAMMAMIRLIAYVVLM